MGKSTRFSAGGGSLWFKSTWQTRLKRVLKSRNIATSPLAGLLLTRIFSLYFGVALVVTIAQAYSQYGDELNALQSGISATVQLIEPALAKTLWDIDRPGTSAIAKGLAGR